MTQIRRINADFLTIVVIAGLGCSMVYSTQVFDGIKTAKTFWFIMVVCLALLYLSCRALWKKKTFAVSLSIPDVLLLLYAAWAVFRLFTSDTDSVHNLYFWEFSACVLWYFGLRYFFSVSDTKEWVNFLSFVFILSGYVQLMVCVLQWMGVMSSFAPFFPVSGTFENISKLCIFLTCILPIAVNAGIEASDTTSTGKLTRAVCLLYVLCWLALVLLLGSRTSLLAGCIGMAVFTGFKTGFLAYLKRRTTSFVRKILVSTVLLLMAGGMVFLLAQYKQDSANGRLLIWKVAWSGIKETPLQGQGFNAFQAKYGHYQVAYFQKYAGNQEEMMIADHINAAFNDYVEVAFNLGIIGLFLFAAFWVSMLYGGGRKIHTKKPQSTQRGSQRQFVAIAVVVIFLVSSGFYFVEKMLPVKVMALFFAAYISSGCRKIVNFQIRALPVKAIAATTLFFSCFAGYATVTKAKHYVQWNKANALSQYGYMEEARAEYERIYPHLQYNGQFLYVYAKTLYENEAYQQCLEYTEMAKNKIASYEFYGLFGDAYFKTGDYKNAITCYEYAASMVPNRFRPLYKLFKLYEEIGETQQAMEIAQNIVNKPVKVDSNEIREMKKECIDFIQLNNNEEK